MSAEQSWIGAFVAMLLRESQAPPTPRAYVPPTVKSRNQRQRRLADRRSGKFSSRRTF